MRKIVLTLLFLCLISLPVLSTDYYIKPNGNDNLSGTTVDNAWATIGKANSTLQAGDTVYILDGTYNETIDPANSGTSGNLITYKNYPGDSPVITGYSTITGWTQYTGEVYYASFPGYGYGLFEDDYATAGYNVAMSDMDDNFEFYTDPADLDRGRFYSNGYVYARCSDGADPDTHTMRWTLNYGADLTDRDYIVIDGITMEYNMRGVQMSNSEHCTVKNCTIHYVYGFGVILLGDSRYNHIHDNELKYCGSWYRDEGDGVHLSHCSYNLVEANDIQLTAHIAITAYGAGNTPHHNIIQDNTVYDGGSSGISAGVYPENNVYRRNKSSNNTGCGIQTNANYNIWYLNECWHNGWVESANSESLCMFSTSQDTHDCLIFHNVFYDGMGSIVGIDEFGAGTFDDNTFKNNVFFKCDESEEIWIYNIRSNLFIYNCIYDPDHIYVQTAGQGTQTLTWWETNYPNNFNNNVQTDPDLVNPDGSPPDFSLQSTSDCINAADWLTTITSNTGSGTSFVVDNARYFIDGYGITDGDTIYFEGGGSRTVTDVDYETDTITVNSSISWTTGDGVSLVAFVDLPDIGAHEYSSSGDIIVYPGTLSVTSSVPTPISVETGGAGGGAWLTGWSYRKKITIQNDNIDSNLSHFPVYVPIDSDSDLSDALATGNDIRFTQDDGTTLLDYERVYWTGGGGSAATAHFYVSDAGWSLSSSITTQIYVYYGKADASDGENKTGVWDSNYVMVHHLDDETTSTVDDSTSSNYDGTKHAANEPIEATGKLYQSQDFDATNDDIDFGSGANIDDIFSGGGTVSWWQYADTVGESNYGQLYFKGLTTNEIYYNGTTNLRIEAGFDTQHGSWTFPCGTGAWNHVAVTYDNSSTSNDPVAYVNGSSVSVTEINTPSGSASSDAANSLYLGGNGSGGYTWDGHVEEFRMSTTARSADWLKFLHANMNEADNELTWGNEETESATNVTVFISAPLSVTSSVQETSVYYSSSLSVPVLGVNTVLNHPLINEEKSEIIKKILKDIIIPIIKVIR